jgi:hypothetical protein
MYNQLLFNTVPGLIKKKKFLLVDSYNGKYFNGIDSKELFNENLKIQPQDWYYRSNKVCYTFNKQSYRTRDFKTIDWANSIVIFGCSHVCGQGVDDSDTISSQLEKITGIPVINMGIIGSSITFSLYNSIILNEAHSAPKAVIQLWTSSNRTIYFNKKSVNNYGPWNLEKNNYMDLWSKSQSHGHTHALFASLISKQIWLSKTQYYEASFFEDTAKILDCDLLAIQDYARDLTHPGRETLKNVAIEITKKIKI